MNLIELFNDGEQRIGRKRCVHACRGRKGGKGGGHAAFALHDNCRAAWRNAIAIIALTHASLHHAIGRNVAWRQDGQLVQAARRATADAR